MVPVAKYKKMQNIVINHFLYEKRFIPDSGKITTLIFYKQKCSLFDYMSIYRINRQTGNLLIIVKILKAYFEV